MVRPSFGVLTVAAALASFAATLNPVANAKVDSSLPDVEEGIVDTQDPDTRCPGCLKTIDHFQLPAPGQIDTCNTGGAQNPYAAPTTCCTVLPFLLGPSGMRVQADPDPATILSRTRESLCSRPTSFESHFIHGAWSSQAGMLGGRGTTLDGMEPFPSMAELYLKERGLSDEPDLLQEFDIRGSIKCSPKAACIDVSYDVETRKNQTSLQRQVTAWGSGGEWAGGMFRDIARECPNFEGGSTEPCLGMVSQAFVSGIAEVFPEELGPSHLYWNDLPTARIGLPLREKSYGTGLPWREAVPPKE